MEKVYLGDGVYVQFDGHHFVLTAEDGTRVTNTIYLDMQVYQGLADYVARLRSGA